MRTGTWIVTALALLAIAVIAFVMIPVYVRHNRETKEAMSVLNQVPLPANSKVVHSDWQVGAYEGASNLCEGLAFIVVRANDPHANIISFYAKLLPALSEKCDSDFHVARADQLPQYPPSEVAVAASYVSPPDRNSTYIIWGIRPLDELSWDIRGW